MTGKARTPQITILRGALAILIFCVSGFLPTAQTAAEAQAGGSGNKPLYGDGSKPISQVVNQTSKQPDGLTSVYWVEVKFDPNYPKSGKGSTVAEIFQENVNRADSPWDCHNLDNYSVTVNGHPIKPSEAAFRSPFTACKDSVVTPGNAQYATPGQPNDLLLFIKIGPHANGDINWKLLQGLKGTLEVSLKNLTDTAGHPLIMSGKGKVDWQETIFTVAAQTVNNETLIDKTTYKKTIYQFPISSNLPFFAHDRSAAFIETKDLFSTNERDSKSAFMGGLGYQAGLSPYWTIPLKLEQQVTGNQTATNLSAVTNMQVSATLPWTDRLTPGAPKLENIHAGALPEDIRKIEDRNRVRIDAQTVSAWHDFPAINNAPSLAIAFPYTHRIHQVVASGSKPLPADDIAINPALALASERLLDIWHPQDNSLSDDCRKAVHNPYCRVPAFTFKWEAELGMYYLPLQTTKAGSHRAEGTGDASILIPISNFARVPGLNLDQGTQVNQMQLRIKWQDSVSATNNYVRTRGWTFGLELAVKK